LTYAVRHKHWGPRMRDHSHACSLIERGCNACCSGPMPSLHDGLHVPELKASSTMRLTSRQVDMFKAVTCQSWVHGRCALKCSAIRLLVSRSSGRSDEATSAHPPSPHLAWTGPVCSAAQDAPGQRHCPNPAGLPAQPDRAENRLWVGCGHNGPINLHCKHQL